jgi:hypothetical protein
MHTIRALILNKHNRVIQVAQQVIVDNQHHLKVIVEIIMEMETPKGLKNKILQ